MASHTSYSTLDAEVTFPLTSRFYDAGNILSVKESVNRVVQMDILERTAQQLELSLNRLDNVEEVWDWSGRPAVVMNACRRMKSGDPIPVCLFATFQGAGRRHNLSLVMQHFSAAIYPHAAIPEEPKEEYFHTHPSWSLERCGSQNTWVILYEFKSSAQVEARWNNLASEKEDRSKVSSFTMCDETVASLKAKSTEKWRGWINRCKTDEAYLLACLGEYKVWKRYVFRFHPHSYHPLRGLSTRMSTKLQ